MLPFTRDEFIATFVAYNGATAPAQIVAYGVGIGLVAAILRPTVHSGRLVAAGLALMWVWTGIVYHGLFFARINQAALGFGALFVVQGLLLAYFGSLRGRLSFAADGGVAAWLGWVLVGYAAVLYPLVGLIAGHRMAELPQFGITPCPVTLFTFGLLLLTNAPVPRWLLALPLAWSLIGGSAAFLLGIPQDWPLLFGGLSVVWLVVRDRRQASRYPA